MLGKKVDTLKIGNVRVAISPEIGKMDIFLFFYSNLLDIPQEHAELEKNPYVGSWVKLDSKLPLKNHFLPTLAQKLG